MSTSNRLAANRYPVTVVIGLEVHAQLKTKTKLFCGCTTQFGMPANTQVCPVCLGMPGALPVINREAIRLSVRTGLALNCSIPPLTKWDRKQYFYPDLPKGYQISQFDLPICADGYLNIADPADPDATRHIGILRAHLEEDAGKSMHDESAGVLDTKIDLNRCGTPLLEIVSQPDLRSSAEAKEYLSELKLLLTHLDVSDCEMQEGSLRADANVNLHLDVDGKKVATPIVEVKNLNSFRNVQRAIDYEIERQLIEWEDAGKTIDDAPKRTFGWDDVGERTFPQREKEESADYRYFPDPDLLPVRLPREWIEEIRESLGELPAITRTRLQNQYGLKFYDADVIVNQGPAMIAYFETAAERSGDPKKASSWIMQEVMRTIKDRDVDVESFPVPPTRLGELIHKIVDGKLDNARARDVFEYLLDHDESVDAALAALGIESVDDNDLLELCRELLADNPQVIADVKAGKQQAVGALIGKARGKNPNANPQAVRQTLLDLIAEA
ncbi:Asp-tRNA(Asn)/Glu-tRNA(Gln) amidotransferase subunit GatB [Allorhodopirellula heiligendammensis]|uniref:Aspartyl/glutamyl-tRNA(Asn/Gln) amidotransferase subunit B n=1 Tax=Allorhodopirellula heiligendammensis TaxID=2714739 RepID=A0A5C6C8A5_9BACT|nr:Asp-tRNA(Asn)/Glu-tRNA(Gln) amidotransferase subunit GatB [Allorhodopirellula heiligendammensis]TWU19666.1 Aspartyl/glutamyl-tRNA(Asn/Gln) amidotransferase subunit B [Allorhodopirellula heiligendammensis]